MVEDMLNYKHCCKQVHLKTDAGMSYFQNNLHVAARMGFETHFLLQHTCATMTRKMLLVIWFTVIPPLL